jgi:hypothetical protein
MTVQNHLGPPGSLGEPGPPSASGTREKEHYHDITDRDEIEDFEL